jgi:maltose/maltodextrin transport system permease protein
MFTQALPATTGHQKGHMINTIIKWSLLGLTFAAALYLVIALYAQNQIAFALLFLVVLGSALFVFINPRTYAHRYIYPAMAGMVMFIIFPLFYTVGIGFTNYSANNLLDFERVQRVLQSQTYHMGGETYDLTVYKVPEGVELVLGGGVDGNVWTTGPIDLGEPSTHDLQPAVGAIDGEVLALRDVIKLKQQIAAQILRLDDRMLSMSSLRSFASISALYTLNDDGTLKNNETQVDYRPNHDTGFYEDAAGKALTPGWTVTIGWGNYLKVLTDPTIREPFIQIFVWTIVFALLTVVFTLTVGLLLANLLQWDQIKGKAFYRMMLILPYAVPAFISILVFKGLFNQNFGEINLVLEKLFGTRPDWFSDPTLARSMLLIVNTWLGYPYMMLLCMGLLQAIPRDLYEASAMDGATPLDNLFQITLPNLIKPLMPLLIASFAFNFNNFVLIALLTGGAPDIIGATTPAGTTDLLVSYTYRIAFQDSGQNFGLAAAIATAIFLLVGSLSLLNLKLSKVQV